MTSRAAFLALGLLGVSAVACAETDSQTWLSFVANHRTPEGWRFFGELQPRFGENDSRMTQFIARAAIGKQATPDWSFWVGYGWTPNLRPDFNSEDRYFLQALWEDRRGDWNLASRTRLEARQIQGTFGTSTRLRSQLRGTTPLGRGSRWTGVLQNEFFYVLEGAPNGAHAGFDQDRLLAGFGYQWSKSTRVEFGYQAVFFEQPRTRRFDVLAVTLFYNF